MLTKISIRPPTGWFSSVALLGAITLSSSVTAHAQAMRHPGAFDSASQFAGIAQAVRQNRQPWAASFARLRTNSHDSPGYQPRPVEVLVRGTAPNHPAENYATLFNDAAAAYALALDWRITGDTQRAARAAAILNAWAGTLKVVTGTSDKYLASGIYGYQLAVAAETLRDFPGWQPRDREEFARMLLTVFAPMNDDFLAHHNGAAIDHYWANWDLANVASLMAIGVFTNRRDLYEHGREYYLHGPGNGAIQHAAWKTYPGGLSSGKRAGVIRVTRFSALAWRVPSARLRGSKATICSGPTTTGCSQPPDMWLDTTWAAMSPTRPTRTAMLRSRSSRTMAEVRFAQSGHCSSHTLCNSSISLHQSLFKLPLRPARMGEVATMALIAAGSTSSVTAP